MDLSIVIGLINNIALLLALGLIYDILGLRRLTAPSLLQQLFTGIILGSMCVAVMFTPLILVPGLVFDTRTVLLSISGLFFGAIPTAIAAVMAAAYRLHGGGPGVWVGLTTIVTSSVIGLAWRHLSRKNLEDLSARELYVFGIVVHVVMMLSMMLLPKPLISTTLVKIGIPVIVIYPIGTAFLGRLMASRLARKRTEVRLRDSEEKYRTLFENNHTTMLIVDPQTQRIVDANPKACEYYGWPRETLTQMKITDINTLPLEQIQENLDLALSGEKNVFHFEHRRADGSIRHVAVHSGPIELEGRTLLCSVIHDVTTRRLAQQKLLESEARFRQLVDSAPLPIFIQTEGCFAYLNRAAVQTFGGGTVAELLGKPFIERFHPDIRDEANSYISNPDNSQQPVSMICMKLDGTTFDAELSAVPFRYDKQDGTLVFFRDISDRIRAEEQRVKIEHQIQQTQKLESLGVLAGGIAHDFNNILMAVLGHADLALTELSPMSPARESIREIERAARRAGELCRQMLAYSGRGNFVIETINLRDLLEEMIHLLKTSITKKAILNLNLEKNLPCMRGDATQIRQVIMNLVINASEAIGERSGVITISTGAMECTPEYLAETYLDEELEPGLYIWVEVSDSGCGMDRETRNRLFEPFFTTKFTGRGLGMAAVLGIVRGHSGALKVYSELGKGTTFKILFPAVEEGSCVERKDDAHLRDWTGKGVVLLVDDEETIRALGKKMLEKIGFDVLVASDGKEALQIYGRHKDEIDLVLLDLTMPRMNGEETFRELRRIDSNVNVLISSGYTESEITSRFAGKGLAGVVQKPYTMSMLKEHLRRALNKEEVN